MTNRATRRCRLTTTASAVLTIGALLSAGCGTAKSGTPSSQVSRSSLPVLTKTTTVPVTIPTLPARRVTSANKPPPSAWPMRTITTTGTAEDITPTSNGVYWLNLSDAEGGYPAPITPVLYDPTSGAVTLGRAVVGLYGSVLLTVTGGWVWMVVAVGDDVVLRQLDPSTLALHASESLRVKNGVSPVGPPFIYPALTSTLNGPMWVAAGDDLWALNPATGAVETKFNTGIETASMSTDPAGNLLYIGEDGTADGKTSVTEFNARTGQELVRTSFVAVGGALVAATTGGVWVSTRSGMAGGVVELSANDLQKAIAPPASADQGFGTFDAMGGVETSVSEGTLWLTGLGIGDDPTLTCADPTTGVVRASESPMFVSSSVASGHLLYAVESFDDGVGEVVAITPPAKCFG